MQNPPECLHYRRPGGSARTGGRKAPGSKQRKEVIVVKNAIGLLLCSVLAVVLMAFLVQPRQKIQHDDSSAFQIALDQAIQRLEGGGAMLLAGTATPAHANPVPEPTYDGKYTCDTFDQAALTCDPAAPGCSMAGLPHTSDPAGHTCVGGAYTCESFSTCDTYDMQALTCDVFRDPDCGIPGTHTCEPAPYNHTCQSVTCDGVYTCDLTVDPRAATCDAADPACATLTFDYAMATCNPMDPICRINNPGHCTSDAYYTCYSGPPECNNPVKKTTWGKLKHEYR
jgi:hypothetical protein